MPPGGVGQRRRAISQMGRCIWAHAAAEDAGGREGLGGMRCCGLDCAGEGGARATAPRVAASRHGLRTPTLCRAARHHAPAHPLPARAPQAPLRSLVFNPTAVRDGFPRVHAWAEARDGNDLLVGLANGEGEAAASGRPGKARAPGGRGIARTSGWAEL